MNIMFFILPKSETAFISSDSTLRQVLEKMEYHRYTALPLIDPDGTYVGTITEGDLLWAVKNEFDLNLKDAEEIPVTDIPRMHSFEPVSADTDISDVIDKALNQNFIPVIDSREKFVGIITRKKIIEYLYKNFKIS